MEVKDVYEALDILFKFASINEKLDITEARRLKKLIGKRLDESEK